MQNKGHTPSTTAASKVVGFDAEKNPYLIGSRCRACGTLAFPEAQVCRECMSEEFDTMALPGEGTLYSYTVLHVGDRKWDRPIALGYIDLKNGLRVFSRLISPDKRFSIGSGMQLGFQRVGQETDGTPIETFVFEPKS